MLLIQFAFAPTCFTPLPIHEAVYGHTQAADLLYKVLKARFSVGTEGCYLFLRATLRLRQLLYPLLRATLRLDELCYQRAQCFDLTRVVCQ
jgi:hypothetical protein